MKTSARTLFDQKFRKAGHIRIPELLLQTIDLAGVAALYPMGRLVGLIEFLEESVVLKVAGSSAARPWFSGPGLHVKLLPSGVFLEPGDGMGFDDDPSEIPQLSSGRGPQ
jgi:hypothetical protein